MTKPTLSVTSVEAYPTPPAATVPGLVENTGSAAVLAGIRPLRSNKKEDPSTGGSVV